MAKFEWNSAKAAANARKHGITFEDAAKVFNDRLALTFDDPDSLDEDLRDLKRI